MNHSHVEVAFELENRAWQRGRRRPLLRRLRPELSFEVEVVLLEYALEQLSVLAILAPEPAAQKAFNHLVELGVGALTEIVEVI